MSSPLTFRVVFYNHAPYAEQCVRSVLAQECPPLQVVFSDDCSTDTTWDIIRRTVDNYKGPHEITLNRNPENLGISDHLNAIWPLSKGDFEIVGAGDDYFAAARAQKCAAKWASLGRPSCSLFSQTMIVTHDGRETRISGNESFRSNNSFQRIRDRSPNIFGSYPGCAHAYTLDQWRIFGPLDSRIIANDVSRQLRSALIGGIAFIPEALVFYRQTGGSLSRYRSHSYQDWRKKHVTYLKAFEPMVRQFQQDAHIAADLNYITTADRDWAIEEADRYWFRRKQEIEGVSGGLRARVKHALAKHSSPWGRFKGLVRAVFPELVYRLR